MCIYCVSLFVHQCNNDYIIIAETLIEHRLESKTDYILNLKFNAFLLSDLTVCLTKETIKEFLLPVAETQYFTEEHKPSVLLGQVLQLPLRF